MSWITVDTDLPDHAKMAALPNDTARWGWLVTLCKAKQQRKPGTFANANHFRHVMGRHARFLEDYTKAGLLDTGEGNTLQVHDWKKHQWAVAKAQQRETSEGHSEDKDETSGGHQEDVSRAVSVSVPVSVLESTEGVQGEPDAAVAFQQRTGQFPGPVFLRWLDELSTSHGERRLAEAIGKIPMTGDNPTTYLRLVRDTLRSEDHAAERTELQVEERRVAEKRAALKPLPSAQDVSEDEAKAQAAAYWAEAKR